MKEPLTFAQLSRANVARCEESFHPLQAWTPLEYGGSLAGETGELCNFLKKMRRGEKIKRKKVEHELADVVVYADLLASALGIDLEAAVREKFNLVSKKKKSKYRL